MKIGDLLDWTGAHAGAIQSVAPFIGIVVSVVTICVLVVTLKAVKRQAAAAEEQASAGRELTQVSKEQTKAATDAADSARKQSELLSAQIEQSTAPLLVAEPDDRPALKNWKLVNRGPGVAFQIFYWRGGFEVRNQGESIPTATVQPSTLGPGAAAYLPIPPAWDTFTVRYKGVDRQERWTVVYRDPARSQQHIVSKGLQQIYLS